MNSIPDKDNLKPCVICGAQDRTPSGGCKPCGRRASARYRARRATKRAPCNRCGSDDLTPTGMCRPCTKARNQAAQAKQAASTTPCPDCGAVDRLPSGPCRPCHRKSKADRAARRRQAGESCAVCGGTAWDNQGSCRPCRQKWLAAQAERTDPCRQCGEANFTPTGICRPCHKRHKASSAQNRMQQPCIACGAVERNAVGDCAACARRYIAAYREAYPDRVLQQRREHAERMANVPCSQCGVLDRMPSGPCRECARQNALRLASERNGTQEQCPKCGAVDWEPGGCRPCLRAYQRVIYHENRDEILARREQRWAALPSFRKKALRRAATLRGAAWVRGNPERSRANRRAWARKNRYKITAANNARRARIQAAGGSFTGVELEAQFKLQQGRCHWCHKKVGKNRSDWHADHVIALARGGTNDISNIVVSCAPCNLKKHTKLPWEFQPGRLL